MKFLALVLSFVLLATGFSLSPVEEESHTWAALRHRLFPSPSPVFYIRAAYASGYSTFLTDKGRPLIFCIDRGHLIPHNGAAQGIIRQKGWTLEEDGIIRLIVDGEESGLWIDQKGEVRRYDRHQRVPREAKDVVWLHAARAR